MSDERNGGMMRETQTKIIVGAILAAIIAYIAYDRVIHPNLDGIHPYSRCDYYTYRTNHGGTLDECQNIEASNAGQRVAAGIGSTSDWAVVEHRKAVLIRQIKELKAQEEKK